jgi:hypothetical protein
MMNRSEISGMLAVERHFAFLFLQGFEFGIFIFSQTPRQIGNDQLINPNSK